MTSPLTPQPKFGLSTEPPAGGKALGFAALWLVTAVIAAMAAVLLAAYLPVPPFVRGVIVVILVLLGVAALMLASDSAARGLPPSVTRWARLLQWLATSFVVLVIVALAGALVTLLAYSQTNALLDFLIDAGVGLVAGAGAVGLIIGLAEGLGALIWRFQRWVGIAERKKQPWRPAERGKKWRWREVRRGLLLGFVGLLLSAFLTALVIPTSTASLGTPAAVDKGLWPTVYGPVLIWFAGTGVVWASFIRRHTDRVRPHSRLRHGTHASALGLCLGIAALWFVAAGVEHGAREGLWSGRRDSTIPAVTVTGRQASLRSPYLAEQFEPQFWLASRERWDPTSVTWYLHHTHISKQSPFCNTNGCREISISPGCDTANPPESCARRGANDPALYYRYKELSNDRGDDQPSSPPGTWTVIQYWIFYNYDSLSAGPITQWHQSDWEQVSVLVLRQGNSLRPVEVAFSEHCYGAVVPAERVRWASGSGAHPISYVGLGSHANYPRRINEPIRQLRCGLGVTPRYLGVAGLFFSPAVDGTRMEIPVAYVIGLRDKADGVQALPMQPLLPLEAIPQITSFKGSWGIDNNLSFYGAGRFRASAGPGAPQLQGPSLKPFLSMFCAHQWLGRPSYPRSETAWTCR